MSLDYIKIKRNGVSIPARLVPSLHSLVQKLLDKKYEAGKFDSELIDLIELNDKLTGVVT